MKIVIKNIKEKFKFQFILFGILMSALVLQKFSWAESVPSQVSASAFADAELCKKLSEGQQSSFIQNEVILKEDKNQKIVICADSEKSMGKSIELKKRMDIYIISEAKDSKSSNSKIVDGKGAYEKTKPLLTLNEKDSEYFSVPSHTGVVVIEKVQYPDAVGSEMFRHEIVCNGPNCRIRPTICIKKGRWTDADKKSFKNKKFKSLTKRLKKLECL